MSGFVVLSNRGPLAWRTDETGNLVARRGAGGLVTAITPALAAAGGTWIASALSDADRAAAAQRLQADDAYHVELLDFPAADLAAYQDTIANRFLWFANHDLWNRPWEPVIDDAAWDAWDGYVRVNTAFADAALAAASDAADTVVLVQDYHLALVPRLVKAARPELRVAHFSHTPFGHASGLACLPDEWIHAVVAGMAAADVCGFHTHRWADRFRDAAAARSIDTGHIGVYPLGPDVDALRADAALPGVDDELAALRAQLGGRRAIVRVDRAELSKNVLRGLQAFDMLLCARPELRDTVAHIVALNPSREAIASYRQYQDDIRELVREINTRHGRDVVLLYLEDRFARSLAAYRLAEVFCVNPISDGMNLVAKEGPLLNEHDAALVLSTEAGAAEALADCALLVNPYDVRATARRLADALDMRADERRQRAVDVRAIAAADPPATWLARQLADLPDAAGAGPI